MQVLYQLDQRGEQDQAAIRESLVGGFDDASVQDPAFKLALDAWRDARANDALVVHLAPDWPTHRQPPVDRAILRLGIFEIKSGYSPASVAINEAVNLAKEYGSENSPAFVNGVLDKIAKRVGPVKEQPKAAQGDGWLADALTEKAEDAQDDGDDFIDDSDETSDQQA